MKAKILIVDDEQDVLEFITYNLRKEGYQVFTTTKGRNAIEIAQKELPDLIILDVMMPEMDGIETCNIMRTIPSLSGSIITFLSARNEDYSQIAGLEAGADDYIAKPIKPKVFISRVKALLRRKNTDLEYQAIELGGISINHEKYTVEKDGELLFFPKKEFELFSLLFSKPGKVFNRNEILLQIWGNDVIVGDRTIDVHIRKLREKLGNNLITTIKGVGYKFNVEEKNEL